MELLTSEIRKQALSEIESAWRHVFRPPEKLTVAEWAEANITLSGRETAHPGSLRFQRTPYLIDIVNDLQDPEVEQITVCTGTQLGKTMSILTMLAYCLAGDPAPTLLVLPNTDLAKSFSQNRLEPLIDDCEQLRKLKPANKDKWTLLEKWFPEATLRLVGSNSPANLASRPIRFLYLDELDKLGVGSNSEASAVELATERVKSFWNRKIVCTSTPTTDIAPIWRRYKDGDQRQYHVPCPKCHSLQLLQFSQVKCSKGSFSDLKDDKGQYRFDEILPNIFYECQHCRFHILDKHKPNMLRQGVWQPQGVVGKHRSYHLNSLYSPWLKFADVVEKFLRIKDVDLQNFKNSWLAEPWVIEGKQNEIDDVLAHKSDYPPQTIPADNPLAVIATVDTQGDRFYYVVRSWHAGETSYLIEYGELEDFAGVKKLAASVYPCGNNQARITHVLLDSGGTRTKEVYAQCRDHRWIPLKGFAASRQQQPLRFSKLDDFGIQLLCINVDYFKFGLQTKIEQPLGQDGAWHLHANTCAIYASSMTAERLVLQKDKSGYEVAKWIKLRERNDFWDCENYQLAAAEKLRIRTRPAGDKMSAVSKPRPTKTGVSCRGGFYGQGA